jgi:uncharacterized protein YfaS (alpha-2-macroglobulin family)
MKTTFLAIWLAVQPLVGLTAPAGNVSGRLADRLEFFPSDAKPGVSFRLSEGTPPKSDVRPVVAAPPAEKLSEAETNALLARLPEDPPSPAAAPFRFPENSLPAPAPGKTTVAAFPPVEKVPVEKTNAGRPLEIVRFGPSGDVPLAANLSVTFSQPMIAVAGAEEAVTVRPPVRLTPQPPGRWRWIGTKTLLFEPDGRFPMATDYAVTVPAGTTSAVGGRLARSKAWRFTTPTPKLVETIPSRKDREIPPDFPLLLIFDQRVEPAAVARAVRIEADGKIFAVRPATTAEIEATNFFPAVKDAGPEKAVVLRVIAPDGSVVSLPLDEMVTVTLSKGFTSAEGPKPTPADQTFAFRTRGGLFVERTSCSYRPGNCFPATPWDISFNHEIDPASFAPEKVVIEPPIRDVQIRLSGPNSLTIQGKKRSGQTYTVKLPPDLRDVFGNRIGEPSVTAPRDVFGNRLRNHSLIAFQVNPSPPIFRLPDSDSGPYLVDPHAPPRLPLTTVNLDKVRLEIRRVEPSDWSDFRLARQADLAAGSLPYAYLTPPGKVVFEGDIATRDIPDEPVTTMIDLAPYLTDGVGHLVVSAQSPVGSATPARRRDLVWVSAGTIGLDAVWDERAMYVRATSLRDGAPLPSVEVTIFPEQRKALTDARGMAKVEIPWSIQRVSLLVATLGNDRALLPVAAGPLVTRVSAAGPNDPWGKYLWHVLDDRKLYQPGETVHFKGWIRFIQEGPRGGVEGLGSKDRTVRFKVKDSVGNDLTSGLCTLNDAGGFDGSFALPPEVNSGEARIEFEWNGEDFTHSFEVESFRRPEFEVTATVDDRRHVFGEAFDVTAEAKYYAGGALPDAAVEWRVRATEGEYRPPNWDRFTFGEWRPWWLDFSESEQFEERTFESRTDRDGRQVLRVNPDAVTPPRPMVFTVKGTVSDVNRQAIAAETTVLVHPASVYVGLRSARPFVESGKPFVVESVVTDLDGKAVAGRPVRLRLAKLKWEYAGGEWKETETPVGECETVSGDGPTECRFEPRSGGVYRLVAITSDAAGRRNQSSLMLWVAGDDPGARPSVTRNRADEVELIPDAQEYGGGVEAEILVRSPFPDARGMVTVEREGIVSNESFDMTGTTHILRIPIEEKWTPNVSVRVALTGNAPRIDSDGSPVPDGPPRPAFASGRVTLNVSTQSRRLDVTVVPRARTLAPGGETVIDVDVRDFADARAGGAEVVVFAVDESVLALGDYKLADPIQTFYEFRQPGTENAGNRRFAHLRDVSGQEAEFSLYAPWLSDDVVLLRSEGRRGQGATEVVEVSAVPVPRRYFARAVRARGGEPEAEPSQAIAVRRNFDPLAIFAPNVTTDAGGRAQVVLKLPDNLTRYRVMAVAAFGQTSFGAGESNLTARLPLMVRPSLPRFLNFGDRCELPVVIQNQNSWAQPVAVAVRATNATLTDGGGRRVTVPANDRVEVRFPATTDRPGEARFAVAAAGADTADAAFITLPVYTPATTEAFATYGELDDGATVQPVRMPKDALPGFGRLEVSASSTQLQVLTDAVVYLTTYPYECSEQLSSRVLTILAIRDVLSAFNAAGLPPAAVLDARVRADLQELSNRIDSEGKVGMWRVDETQDYPFLSIHVAHAFARAKEKGIPVNEENLDSLKDYLRDIETRIPEWYGEEVRKSLVAYALYVLALLDEGDATKAKLMGATPGQLPLEAVGWLLGALAKDESAAEVRAGLLRHLGNRVAETAGEAHFVTNYGDGDFVMFGSSRRADGVILDALIAADPQNDLIPKVVRGLLAHRTRGRWSSTQENVFILLALDRYFRTFEKATPDFVARVWLGDRFAGEQRFQGRTTDQKDIRVPLDQLGHGVQPLTVGKTGPGRLYYRIGLNYAPASLDVKPFDAGFAVARKYEALDDPSDVTRDPDGTWRVRAGARVRIRVTMTTTSRRYHVALNDPLPAGFEPLNPELKGTGLLPPAPEEDEDADEDDTGSASDFFETWRWRWQWFDHQNLRNDHAEAFAALLYDGTYTFTYYARATTPGEFIAPPSKAEEMYHPETFGRGASARVVVVERAVERALPPRK